MTPRQIGYSVRTDDTRQRLLASPTGRQLAVDGSLVVEIVTFDPGDPSSNTTQVWPDGAEVIYVRTGTQERWSFTRETGWQQV